MMIMEKMETVTVYWGYMGISYYSGFRILFNTRTPPSTLKRDLCRALVWVLWYWGGFTQLFSLYTHVLTGVYVHKQICVYIVCVYVCAWVPVEYT